MNTFPSTAELLVQGGDARLRLDPLSGANHYLCRPQPDPELLRLGSSTASSISVSGFDVANRLRDQMAEACRSSDLDTVYQAQARHIVEKLRSCLHLDAKTVIELAESGTDAHRLAVRRMRNPDRQRPLRILMVEASETGSGVPDALSPSPVCSHDGRVRCSEIAIRDADAMPLSTAAIDATVFAWVEQAIQRGEQVLLVMVDQSKSGCIAPSLSCGLDLRHRYPGQIQLLLDGCQFRFSARTLRHYLAYGIMVAITGSKFLAGPSFSAALLLPDSEPADMDTPAPGLLLRWQVALATLAELSRLDDGEIRVWLAACGHAIEQRLIQEPVFEPLITSAIVRSATGAAATEWDDLPTIFPFCLRTVSATGEIVSASYADAMGMYEQLQQGEAPRLQLGRPIQAGRNRNGEIRGALRLCISAPMVIDAIASQQQSAMIEQCMQALDSVAAVCGDM